MSIADPIDTPISTLDKQGAGTLTLSAANTYTGKTTITAGVVAVSTATALGATSGTGTTEVADGAVLSLSGTYTTFAEALTISGTGGGNGAVRSTSGNKTLTGAVTLGASATIQSDADTLTLSTGVAVTTSSGKDLTVSGAGATDIYMQVTGAGSLVKSGAGTLTLRNSSNNYSGTTTIDGGTLAIGGSGAVPDATAVSVSSGATLSVGYTETIGSLSGAGSVTMTSNLLTGGNNGSTTFSGATTGGSGRLTKQGTGTMTLSGTNLHTGGVTVSAGVLEVSADTNLGAVPVNATADRVVINGGTLSVTTGFMLSSNRGMSLGSSIGTIQVASGQTLTYGGIVANVSGQAGALAKTGAGTLTLSGTNTFTGKTTVSLGTLSVAADNNLGSEPGSAVVDQLKIDGGTLATTADFAIGTKRGVTIGDSDGTVNVASGTTLTYGGVIAGASASADFTKAGAGTLILSGTSTYAGATSISAGKLQFSSSSAGELSSSTAVTVSSGATFAVNGRTTSVGSIAGAGTITLGAGTLTAGGDNSSTTYTGAISGTGGLTKA
ncbi:MAG: hypothetical protein EBV24_10885, partial [Actinobacteria bacterium]|nr:hypothetical protein [Actinomycetota bacterium]